MENIDKIDLSKLEREVRELKKKDKQLDRKYKEIRVCKLLQQKEELLTRIKKKEQKLADLDKSTREEEDTTTGWQETVKVTTLKKRTVTPKVRLSRKGKLYEERRMTRQ